MDYPDHHQLADMPDFAGTNRDHDTRYYSRFQPLVLRGDALVWDDQQINVATVRLRGAVDPEWTNYKGSEVLAFDGGGARDEVVDFSAQLTHRYKEGSDLSFHIHYVPEDGTAGNVRWVFTHSWANIGGTFPAETTVTTIIPTPEVADQHSLGTIAATIDGTGKTISSVLLCSLTRESSDATDTYNGLDIYVVALDFHIQHDMIGSRTSTSK